MLRNTGRYDRLVRVLVGALLLSLAFVGPQSVWGLLGFVPLLTGLFGYCPVYALLGVSTCQKDESPGARPRAHVV